jgi:cytochrome bd ubiquinol oxidase subunit II
MGYSEPPTASPHAALCAQLASSFVALRLVRSGQQALAERFRLRGLQSATSVLLLSLAAPAVAITAAPSVWHRLIGPALPVVSVGIGAQALSLLGLWRRRYRLARGACLLSGAAVLWGWFVIQAPHLIGHRLTIHSAAATHAALGADKPWLRFGHSG